MSGLDEPDAALAAALGDPDTLSLEGLAEEAGLSLPLLEALAREGLLLPAQETPDGARYARDDAAAVEAAMALVDAGVPLAELLELARAADAALRPLADHAVEVFLRFVRDPALVEDEAAATRRLLTAYERMLPAATDLVAGHFTRLVLARARERVAERHGS